MVVTLRPATADAGVTHERTAVPSMCTVHAPHTAMPHPYLVPVRLSDSRSTQSSGISSGTSTYLRLTVNEIMTASWLESTAVGVCMIRRSASECLKSSTLVCPESH